MLQCFEPTFQIGILGGVARTAQLPPIAQNLTDLMGDEITQEDLAERSGLDQSAISKYATGKAKPNVANLLKLAVGLGVSVESLVKGVNAKYDEDRGPATTEVARTPEQVEADALRDDYLATPDLEARQTLRQMGKTLRRSVTKSDETHSGLGPAPHGSSTGTDRTRRRRAR